MKLKGKQITDGAMIFGLTEIELEESEKSQVVGVGIELLERCIKIAKEIEKDALVLRVENGKPLFITTTPKNTLGIVLADREIPE